MQNTLSSDQASMAQLTSLSDLNATRLIGSSTLNRFLLSLNSQSVFTDLIFDWTLHDCVVVQMMRFISVLVGWFSELRWELAPFSSLFSPWKMVGYHPLAISGLTRVLFTRWIQIENHPLKKHEKIWKSSHNNERYQGAILVYRGLGWRG